MKLGDIAFRTSVLAGIFGTVWHTIIIVFLYEPPGITKPWGVICGVSMVSFWAILAMLTPKKWWT